MVAALGQDMFLNFYIVKIHNNGDNITLVEARYKISADLGY
jgi:hypothetical protein